MNKLDAFIEELRQHYPIKIAYKDESWLMKLIGKVLWKVNPTFMTTFVTTIGNTIYFPSKEQMASNDLATMLVICHEYQHIRDSHKLTYPLYAFIYLFPQILALLALLAIPLAFLVPWQYALISLVAVLFVAPIPAYGRMKIELRGYSMSLFALSEFLKGIGHDSAYITAELSSRANIYDQYYFRGPAYYFMWPFGVRTELGKVIEQIRTSGDISDETYTAVSSAIRKFN